MFHVLGSLLQVSVNTYYSSLKTADLLWTKILKSFCKKAYCTQFCFKQDFQPFFFINPGESMTAENIAIRTELEEKLNEEIANQKILHQEKLEVSFLSP